MCQQDPRKFWKEVKHRVNSKTKIPTNVDGEHGDDNIGSMWKHHYENSCISVKVVVIKLTLIYVRITLISTLI